MPKLPLRHFSLMGDCQDDGEYRDYFLTDNLPKGIRRLWMVTEHSDTGTWSAALRRSETDDGEFGDEIVLPKEAVNQLAAFIQGIRKGRS